MATHAVPGTGLELILNAAEGVLQIVVTEDEAILCAQEWYRSERATEILAPALAELATSLGIRWSDLRRIACVRGPGSFTGIRLTLATAAALRRCGRAQLAGLDYMQALATTAVMRRGMLYGGHVWVLTHARRNLVHCQPFISYGPEIPAQPLQGVTLCTPAEAVAAITADTADATLVCGTGLRRYAVACAPLENLPAVTCPVFAGAAWRLCSRGHRAAVCAPLRCRGQPARSGPSPGPGQRCRHRRTGATAASGPGQRDLML